MSGAAVTTALLRPDGQRWATQAATTGADGWALFSKAATKAQKKGLYTITVTNVAKGGAAYDPGANVRSSTTFTLEQPRPSSPRQAGGGGRAATGRA